MRKLIKTAAIGISLAIVAGWMISHWGAIHQAHNRYGAAPVAQSASAEICKDYNAKGFFGKMIDWSARGWCD